MELFANILAWVLLTLTSISVWGSFKWFTEARYAIPNEMLRAAMFWEMAWKPALVWVVCAVWIIAGWAG